MGSISAVTKKSLDQQPPRARRHDCATTSTTARTVEILLVLVQHHTLDSRGTLSQPSRRGYGLRCSQLNLWLKYIWSIVDRSSSCFTQHVWRVAARATNRNTLSAKRITYRIDNMILIICEAQHHPGLSYGWTYLWSVIGRDLRAMAFNLIMFTIRADCPFLSPFYFATSSKLTS
jgi:hypothetical protein